MTRLKFRLHDLKKMKPKYKKMWLKALRSGDFTQGVQRLRNSTGKYCCLGVLLEVDPEGKLVRRDRNSKILVDASAIKSCWELNLPTDDTIARWGLNKAAMDQLAQWNDDGYTFEEIADVIEREL